MSERWPEKSLNMNKQPEPEEASFVGRGGELEKIKETRAVEKVANEVLWANPAIKLPFRLEVGKPTDLGVFVSAKERGGEEDGRRVEVAKEHGRAGLLGRVVFVDEEGRKYRDVDLKGIGKTSEQTTYSSPRKEMGRVLGFMDLESAEYDRDISEKFLQLGIQTHRVAGIIKLKEIILDTGEKISVEEAKQRKILDETEEPVVEVRAMGTRNRALELSTLSATDFKKAKLLIEDGKALVASELGIAPEKFSIRDYVTWFAKNLGTQARLMHENGYIHNYFTAHNITLDGKLVDFDSVERDPSGQPPLAARKGDVRAALTALDKFVKSIKYWRDFSLKYPEIPEPLFEADSERSKAIAQQSDRNPDLVIAEELFFETYGKGQKEELGL